VLIIVLSSTVLSVFAKENPNEGQPFQGILDAIDEMKESIAGQLDSLLDAITGSKQEIIGNITESHGEIQGSVSASEENVKDAILQAETEVVSNITDARDEISGKIDNIQYDGLVIKSKEWNQHLVGTGHWHGLLDIWFRNEPGIVKAIYIDPGDSNDDIDLHFYEASVSSHVEPFDNYHLDITDYNPKAGEESLEGFEVLNKFDLHEIALPADSAIRIFLEAGAATYPTSWGLM